MSSDTDRPVTTRVSERGAATRGALLEAAKEVFVSSGFAEAGVTEVVARANASVGSLYHHFSGKAELYTALFDEFQDRQIQRTKHATQAARAQGVTDPMGLLIAGARAYIEGCFEEKDLSALFLRGDGPPGFEVYMRERLSQWVRRNAALFEEDERGALAVVLTGALAAVAQQVSLSDDTAAARRLADEALVIISGIRRPDPAPGDGSGEAAG